MSDDSFGSISSLQSDKENSLLNYGISASDSYITESFSISNISKLTLSVNSPTASFGNPNKTKVHDLLGEVNSYIHNLEEKINKSRETNTDFEFILQELNTQKEILLSKQENNSASSTFLMIAENKQKNLISEAKSLLDTKNKPPLSIPPLKLKQNLPEASKTQSKYSKIDEEIAKKLSMILKSVYISPEDFIKQISTNDFDLNFPNARNEILDLFFNLKEFLVHSDRIEFDKLKEENSKLKIENLAYKRNSHTTVQDALALQELHYSMKHKNNPKIDVKNQLLNDYRIQLKTQNDIHRAQVDIFEAEIKKLQDTIEEISTQRKIRSDKLLEKKINELEIDNRNLLMKVNDYKTKQNHFKSQLVKERTNLSEEQTFVSDEGLILAVRLEITNLIKNIEKSLHSAKNDINLEQFLADLHNIALLLLKNKEKTNHKTLKSENFRSQTPNLTYRSIPQSTQRSIERPRSISFRITEPKTITFSKDMLNFDLNHTEKSKILAPKPNSSSFCSKKSSPNRTAIEILEEYLMNH